MAYIIVLDGGGTKTKGCTYTLSGRLLEEHTAGFSNPMVDLKLSMDHIVEVLKALTLEEPPEAIVLGIAGSAQASVQKLLKDSIQSQINAFLRDVHMILVDDLTLSYYAAFRGSDGILGLLGTGSALLTRVDGKWLRMGGYGHILGDEGSGYVLAVETLKEAIHRTYEGAYTLADKVIEYFKLETLEDIKEIVYRSPKALLASLAEKVFEWEVEEALTPVIEKQIDLFAALTMMLLKQGQFLERDFSDITSENSKLQIELVGGMVQNNSSYFERIKTRMKEVLCSYNELICAEQNLLEQENKFEVVINCLDVDACEGGLYLYNEYIYGENRR